MNQNDIRFLQSVQEYVTNNPHVAAYVSKYVEQGINVALIKEKDFSIDLEALVHLLLNRRSKATNAVIVDKLERVKDKCRFNVQPVIDDLKSKLK